MNDSAEAPLPKVAIVLVNFRTPDDTIRAVRSLEQLHYPATEIFVVDNASGDDSVERFEAALANHTLLVAPSNGGYTAGNNLGIRAALASGADYVHVLNPDTVVLDPDYLTRMVEFLESNPRVGVVGPRVHFRQTGRIQNTILGYPWLHRRLVDAIRVRLMGIPTRSGAVPEEVEVLNGVCLLFRKACLEEVGLFDERTFAYVEDVDWSYRADRLGWSRFYLPIDSILHLQRSEGYDRGGRVDFLLKRNNLYFLMKTGHWLQAAGYTAASVALAMAYLAGALPRPRDFARLWRWTRALARVQIGLWMGDWSRVMGRPPAL